MLGQLVLGPAWNWAFPPKCSNTPGPLSSQTFGRYELLERVSVGGMAEIFRAADREADRVVAIKRILPEVSADDEFVKMFRDEAKIISQLEHPNICRILDLGRVGFDYYLALEFVDGLDLRAIFDRAAKGGLELPLGLLLHVFSAVCEGLEYAHRRRDPSGRPMSIVHRDVSPQNVIVGFDGVVKLIDFGIAKAAGKLSRTQVGTIKGKYGYMSPEQVRGLPIDHRSDVFSLGICLWELLTLERLFALDNELLIMERISNAQIPPPSRKNPRIPEALDQILARALTREASDRYPSAADLYADLQAFAFSENLLWQTGHVADYMARTFGRGAAKQKASFAGAQPPNSLNKSPLDSSLPLASFVAARVQEQPMSDNKGSDLDVFEGLTSKRGPRPTGPSNAPPPPPSRSVPPPPPGRSRQPTMVGMAPPLPPPPSGPRTSTPPIAPPPSRAGAAPPPPPPSRAAPPPPPPPTPAAAAPPPPAARAATVDMDWDDEDEKTHIYDKDQVAEAMGASPSAPPKGLPPPPANLKGTQVGMLQPLPPPPSRQPGAGSAPPPPAPLPPPSSPMGAAPVASAPPAPLPTPLGAPMGQGQFGIQQGMGLGNMPPNTPVPSGMPPMGMAATAVAPAPQQMPVQAAPSFPPQQQPAPQMAPQQAPPAPRPIADATQVVRPNKSNTGLILGGIALAAIAGVAAFFFMSSRPGNVLVNVNIKGPKSGLKVFLDQSEKCSDTTCRIEGVSPGVHAVKAMIGEAEAKATITVEAGKDAVANLNLEVVSKKTGLTVASSIDGLKVEIDGEKAEKLPLKEFELKPGKHKLKFIGGSKYATKEVDINVEEGQIKALDDVKLTLKVVKTKFVFLTKGLKAQLDDGKTKTDLKDDGQPIELDTTKSYTVTGTATGFEDYSKKLEFGDDPDMTVKLELTEKGKAAPPATTTAPPATTVAPPATTTAPPPSGGDGTLFVNTLPPSNCVVNGTPRGHTPLTIKLPAGPANVTCVAKDGDETLKKSGSTTVKAGDKVNLILKLRD